MNSEIDVSVSAMDSDAGHCDPETDKASEIFANICEIIFKRGRNFNTHLLNQCANSCIEQIFNQCTHAQNDLHFELKKIGYMGHPIIIEFLLLPKSEININSWSLTNKHIPAFLLEQWTIHFLPKRLVTDTLSDISCLLNDIDAYCKSSVVNKILFTDAGSSFDLKLSNFCCVSRLTNLRGANVFSSCWFTLSINDLFNRKAKIDVTDLGFRLIRDFSDNFNTPDGAHTTAHSKSLKRTYLCNHLCSNNHRNDNTRICTSTSLSRVLAGCREILDTIVTSVLEPPVAPLNNIIVESLQCLHNGTMSLPTRWQNKTILFDVYSNPVDESSKCKVPKNPVVIMSRWTNSTCSVTSPPCKLKRMQEDCRPRVDDCISQFTSLGMQQQRNQAQANKSLQSKVCTLNADSEMCTLPLVQKSTKSKSFTESTFQSLSFNPRTGLPLRSSPIPINRTVDSGPNFSDAIGCLIPKKADTDYALPKTPRPVTLALKRQSLQHGRTVCASAPATGLWGRDGILTSGTPLPPLSSHQLIINFEESMLNGRIPPKGTVEGYSLGIGASGSFFPVHVKLPISAYFFQLTDDNSTPSPYLGLVDLTGLSNKRGYHVPHKGSIQLTLFNPSHSVMKLFVIQYDLEDMPANCQTFLRQRTIYMPVVGSEKAQNDLSEAPSDLMTRVFKDKFYPLASTSRSLPIFLRYLVHLRFHTTKSNSLYLHTDIRLIFTSDTFEFDPDVANYRMHSFIDVPNNPRFSPKTG